MLKNTLIFSLDYVKFSSKFAENSYTNWSVRKYFNNGKLRSNKNCAIFEK